MRPILTLLSTLCAVGAIALGVSSLRGSGSAVPAIVLVLLGLVLSRISHNMK